MQIKFFYNGIKIDGKLFKGWWSDQSTITNAPVVTFYASTYELMPFFGEKVHNNSDSTTDYFEKDHIRFFKDSPFYGRALAAHALAESRRLARRLVRA